MQLNYTKLSEILTVAMQCWYKDIGGFELKLENSLGDYHIIVDINSELTVSFTLKTLQHLADKDPVKSVINEIHRILQPLVPKYRHDAEMAKLSEELDTYRTEIERLQSVLQGATELVIGLGFAARGGEVFKLVDDFNKRYATASEISEKVK